MSTILEKMIEYKAATIELISLLENDNYDALDMLLDRRQTIIKALDTIEYDNNEFKEICNQLQLEDQQSKLTNLFETKMSIVKNELKKVRLSKSANKSYTPKGYTDSIYFNKKL